jgi:hypothetical protein
MAKAELGSHAAVQKWTAKAAEFWIKFPHKFARSSNNVSVSGEYISNSKNVTHSYAVDNGENLKYCYSLVIGSAKDCYDYHRFCDNAELVYETLGSGTGISNVKFSLHCFPACRNLNYSLNCSSSSDLFGCFGLKKKQYCILNKQYTKEEYEALVPRIIEHMKQMPYISQMADGKEPTVYKYGEFFPPEFSPFAYNESIAPEFFPIAESEAIAKGYRWGDISEKDYKATMAPSELPDSIQETDDSILTQVISCAHEKKCLHPCSTAFRVVPRELEFYREFNIPLPRLCFSCRYYENLKLRNPFKMNERKCMCAGEHSENGVYKNLANHLHGVEKCPVEFETSYAPNRLEIVYCEQCYNAEVA